MKIKIDSQSIKAHIGISIKNKFFSKKNMRACFQWAKENCSEFLVLIGDEPQKYNFMAFDYMTEEEALKKSLQIGGWKYKELTSLKNNLNAKMVRIIRWNDIKHEQDYLMVRKLIAYYFDNNNQFSSDVENEMRHAIPNRINKAVHEKGLKGKEQAEKIAKEYALDEIAGFIFISEYLGYPIRISKEKQLPVIEQIYNDKYPGLKSSLGVKGNLSHIQIKITDF